MTQPICQVQVGLSKAALDGLPESSITELEMTSDACLICLEEWGTEDARVVRLGCEHCFHPSCIKQWLEEHTECPVCKFVVEGDRELR